jgi:hypothetical protein
MVTWVFIFKIPLEKNIDIFSAKICKIDNYNYINNNKATFTLEL